MKEINYEQKKLGLLLKLKYFVFVADDLTVMQLIFSVYVLKEVKVAYVL